LQQQSSWLEATPEEETPSEAGSDGSAVSTGERRLHDALAATVDRLETTTADLVSSRHLLANMEQELRDARAQINRQGAMIDELQKARERDT
jgi:hypothetical protein